MRQPTLSCPATTRDLRGEASAGREPRPLQVTPQAISLMLTRHRRSFKSLRDALELNSLSARAVNALGRHGIRTPEKARKANVLALLAGERKCGRKTMDEIGRWVEEENPELSERALHTSR